MHSPFTYLLTLRTFCWTKCSKFSEDGMLRISVVSYREGRLIRSGLSCNAGAYLHFKSYSDANEVFDNSNTVNGVTTLN